MLAFVAFGTLHPLAAAAYPPAVDRRVTAIPAQTLLAEPATQLIDRRRQRVAERFRGYGRPIFFVWALSQIAAFLYLWASGFGARLREFVRARVRAVFAMRFAYGALLSIVASLASFPAALL